MKYSSILSVMRRQFEQLSGGSGFLGDTVNENASAGREEAKMESSSADRAYRAAPQAYGGSEGSPTLIQT